jgi:hypothetical protein
MSSMTRSIRRGIIFANTNKQQRTYYRSSTPEKRKEFEMELGEKLKVERKFAGKKIYIPRKKEVEKLDRA